MVPITYTSPNLISLFAYYVSHITLHIEMYGIVVTDTLTKILQWVLFTLCLFAFSVRVYIRYVCFHRILFEDYIMLLALGCHLALAILGQIFLGDLYYLTAVEHGGSIDADFFTDALQALKAFGVMSIVSIAGIWLIKLNFLLFFYRLGHQVRTYRIFWWIVFVFSIGCGAGCFGLLQYPCMFGGIQTVFVKCATVSATRDTYIHVIMTAVLDIFSDIASKYSQESSIFYFS